MAATAHALYSCETRLTSGTPPIAFFSRLSTQTSAEAASTSSESKITRECWSCHGRFSKGVVCAGCEKVQPLDKSLNYFELLGM